MIISHLITPSEDTAAMLDKYEKAAIDYDREHTEMLKQYLRKVDPDGELRMIGKGKSVMEWAVDFISRDLSCETRH